MKILFILDCSFKVGFGNLSRCYLLFKELKKKNKCYFWIENSNDKIIKKFYPRLPIIKKKKKNLKNFLNSNFFDRIIFDNNYIKVKNIKKRNKQKIIALDYYFRNSMIDIRINLLKKNNYTKKKIFAGLKYALFHNMNVNLKKKKKKNFYLLISFGGGVKQKTYRKIFTLLKKINFKDNIYIIKGFYEEKKVNDPKLKIIYLKFKRNYVHLIKKADLIITNAGNTLLLSCLLGIPSITIPKNNNESNFAKFMENKGATIVMDRLNKKNLFKYKNLINRKKYFLNQANIKKKIIDGKGLNRVVDIISA
jgi:spore coat polysaccharide biosynthesis predicted glycosyltransferase SpsG